MKFPGFPLRPALSRKRTLRHWLSYQTHSQGTSVLVSKYSSFYSLMAPTHRGGGAGHVATPTRSREAFPSNEKMQVLYPIRKEKINGMLRSLRSMVKMNLLSVKWNILRRRRSHIQVIFITAYCYHCSTLLLFLFTSYCA